MNVGFSGTARGMTPAQCDAVERLLGAWTPGEFHHGVCVGADYQAHNIARRLGYRIIAHPPVNPKARATITAVSEWRDPLPYLERNQAIVNEAEVLVAAPEKNYEVLRSGTWATVRRARQRGLPLYVYGPDGCMLSDVGVR